MRAPQLPTIDLAEIGLKFTGVALAGGSVAFAAHMMSDPSHPPRITGVEHLAIYAKPSKHAAQSADRPPGPGIDYTPVGSIAKNSNPSILAGYEILDASSDWALVRRPEGRIVRVLLGGRMGGVGRLLAIEQRGGKWALVTERGVIRAR